MGLFEQHMAASLATPEGRAGYEEAMAEIEEQRERAADDDIAAGRVSRFESAEAFLESLE